MEQVRAEYFTDCLCIYFTAHPELSKLRIWCAGARVDQLKAKYVRRRVAGSVGLRSVGNRGIQWVKQQVVLHHSLLRECGR